MQNLTDAQWRALAVDIRNAKTALDTAQASMDSATSTLAKMLEQGGEVIVAGWRFRSPDGQQLQIDRVKVVQ